MLLALEVQGHCRGIMGTVGPEFKDSFPKGGCNPNKALGSTLCPRPFKIASVLPFNTCERGPFFGNWGDVISVLNFTSFCF